MKLTMNNQINLKKVALYFFSMMLPYFFIYEKRADTSANSQTPIFTNNTTKVLNECIYYIIILFFDVELI